MEYGSGEDPLWRDWPPTVEAVHAVCALLGALPSVWAAYEARLTIGVASLLASAAAIVHVSVPTSRALVPGAVDAGASVVLTLACATALCAHRTMLGSLRVLWLVVLVTSSCGFNYVKAEFPGASFVPNDVTIFALVGSAVVLLAYACVAHGGAGHAGRRDRRGVIFDGTLALGGFALRFREDIARLSGLDVGLAVWYVLQWTAVGVALWILRTPRNDDVVVHGIGSRE